MNSTIRLLNAVREALPKKSDYAVAKAIGISPQRVCKLIHGHGQLEDEAAIIKAANLIGEDAALVIARLRAERAADPTASQLWLRVENLIRQAARHAAAAVVFASILSTSGLPGNTNSPRTLSLRRFT